MSEPRVRATPWWIGATAGLIAAASGLAAAELVAGLRSSWRSPVLSVGDRVIDATPPALKDWAISTFGTANKTVLLGSVAVVLAGLAIAAGLWATRRHLAGALVGVAVVTTAGVAASLGRGTSSTAAVVPAVAAGVVAASVLTLLVRRARQLGLVVAPDTTAPDTTAPDTTAPDTTAPDTTAPDSGEPHTTAPDSGEPHTDTGPTGSAERSPVPMGTSPRRRFLTTAAGFGVGAVAVGAAGRWLHQRGVAATERLRVVLPRPAVPAPAVPATATVDAADVSSFLTPNEDFFRIDTALSIPQVDPGDWTLSVVGLVDRELTLSYDDLLSRPMVETDITIACVSNEVGGNLIGTARWLGCRLDDLLDQAGIDPDADQVVGRSVDGFTAGFPTALLDGRDALVAVGMNGEPLPLRHGFPARLVVPGVYGYVSATKWLSEIELTRFDTFEGYWVPRGWAAEGPIKTQSRIDTPRAGSTVDAGSPTAVAGVAWSAAIGVRRVEVQIDEDPWREAQLGEQYLDTTWRQWLFEWTPSAGEHRIRVRATDGEGRTQTEERAPVAPDGATGWHTVTVEAV